MITATTSTSVEDSSTDEVSVSLEDDTVTASTTVETVSSSTPASVRVVATASDTSTPASIATVIVSMMSETSLSEYDWAARASVTTATTST